MPWTDTEALRPLKPEIWDLQTLQIFQINLFDHRKAWFNHDTTPISSKPTELTDCLSGSRCSHRNRRSPRRSWCLYWRCRIEFLSGSPLFRTNSQVPKTLIRWYFDVKCIHIWQNMLKYDLFLSFSSFFCCYLRVITVQNEKIIWKVKVSWPVQVWCRDSRQPVHQTCPDYVSFTSIGFMALYNWRTWLVTEVECIFFLFWICFLCFLFI